MDSDKCRIGEIGCPGQTHPSSAGCCRLQSSYVDKSLCCCHFRSRDLIGGLSSFFADIAVWSLLVLLFRVVFARFFCFPSVVTLCACGADVKIIDTRPADDTVRATTKAALKSSAATTTTTSPTAAAAAPAESQIILSQAGQQPPPPLRTRAAPPPDPEISSADEQQPQTQPPAVTGLSSTTPRVAASARQLPPPPMESDDSSEIDAAAALMDRGYSRHQAERAMRETGGDIAAAVRWLEKAHPLKQRSRGRPRRQSLSVSASPIRPAVPLKAHHHRSRRGSVRPVAEESAKDTGYESDNNEEGRDEHPPSIFSQVQALPRITLQARQSLPPQQQQQQQQQPKKPAAGGRIPKPGPASAALAATTTTTTTPRTRSSSSSSRAL